MKVFLNLLAVSAGGQLSRARAFLDRFDEYAPQSTIVVLKEKVVLAEYAGNKRRVLEEVKIGSGRLKTVRRMWAENLKAPNLVARHAADVYLTFSHYLPHLDKGLPPSVVGVSNLAPFSKEAWCHESALGRLRLAALRRTIISSTRRATYVLALSETCRRVLMEHGISGDKIAVTPNGVDSYWGQSSKLTGLLPRWGIVRPYLLYVSHFYKYKNHARLIEAYLRLPPGVRTAHQLVLVGGRYDASCFDGTQKLIKDAGLSGDVILIPGEDGDRLRALYQGAKLFVFPSLIENSPNVLLEAMMAGAAVVASSIAPMPEFCGAAAEYFDALSVNDMTQRMESLLSDAKRIEDLKQRSRVQALRFTWDGFVRGVVHQLERAAG